MFTGIIEATGKVISMQKQGSNLELVIESAISNELHVDQSVSHNGVCLTVTKVSAGAHAVTAVLETLMKSNLGSIKAGDLINLERCMPANGRFDGHIVQGHVDATARVTQITDLNGSWKIDFEYDSSCEEIVVEKGSVCINGVSLTCFNCSDNKFSVAIIPYTWSHTNINFLKVDDFVNIEFDILGKYLRKLIGAK